VNLSNIEKINRKRKKRGRGSASGGKFFGRGTKGQNSRTNSGRKPTGFEGGQTPLKMRLPKYGGFKPHKRIEYETLNLKDISGKLAREKSINKKVLFAAGLIKSLDSKLKILGDGEIKLKINFEADAFSKSALKKIEKAGGKIIITPKLKGKGQKNKNKIS
jgi:large subunit ribosomal protein L15